ncbi:hypothetical protein ABQF26_11070, partial [Mycolicibacterium elephantis]
DDRLALTPVLGRPLGERLELPEHFGHIFIVARQRSHRGNPHPSKEFGGSSLNLVTAVYPPMIMVETSRNSATARHRTKNGRHRRSSGGGRWVVVVV